MNKKHNFLLAYAHLLAASNPFFEISTGTREEKKESNNAALIPILRAKQQAKIMRRLAAYKKQQAGHQK